MRTVSKILLKLELKPNTEKDRDYIESLYERGSSIIDIASSIIKHVYPMRVKPKYKDGRCSYGNSYELRDALKELIPNNYTEGISEISNGLLGIMHNNAEVSYHHRSFPTFTNLKDVLPIRISKFTPSWKKVDGNNGKKQERAYPRDGEFFLKNNRLYFKVKNATFYVADKLGKERLQLLADAIHGNGISIGDPCLLIRKKCEKGKYKGKYRYFLHVSISKPVQVNLDKIKDKDKIRIIGVDLGISSYLAFLSCIEYDKINDEFKIIRRKGIKSKQLINLLDRYERKKRNRMSSINKQQGVKRGLQYKISNNKGESLRVDYTRQFKGYVINRIIEYANAKEKAADVIVIEDLEGLHYKKKELKKQYKYLGSLYSRINKNGLKVLDELKDSEGSKNLHLLDKLIENKDKGKSKKYILDMILNDRRKIKRIQQLLSYLAYNQFKEDLDTEALFNDKVLKVVHPSYSSLTCIRCGNVNKYNRVTRSRFICSNCNFKEHADFLASINIALRCIAFFKKSSPKGDSRTTYAEIVKGLILKRQERVSRYYSKNNNDNGSLHCSNSNIWHPLPMQPNNAYARGVSHSTPASVADPIAGLHKGDEGVQALGLGQTNALSMQGLLAEAKEYEEQRGNGG